jgi:hypothetical protein
MSVPFALSSAVAYGFGDFAGGLAARRTPVLRVTAVAQVAGLLALLPAAFLVPGHVSAAAVGFGALAGVGGISGLLLYMRVLAVGPTVSAGVASQAMYYAANVAAATAGANAVTVTFTSAATAPSVGIAEYAGANTATPLDVTVAAGPVRAVLRRARPHPDGSGLWHAGRLAGLVSMLLALALLVGAARPAARVALMRCVGARHRRERAVPAGHADRLALSVSGGAGVALPGGRRAAGADRAEGAADRAAAHGGRPCVDGERATRLGGVSASGSAYGRHDGSQSCASHAAGVIGTPTRMGHR